MKSAKKKPKLVISTIFSLGGLVLIPTIIILIILATQVKKNLINQNIILERESASLMAHNIEREILYNSNKSSIFNDNDLISLEVMQQFYKSTYKDSNKTIFLVNNENTIIASNNEELIGSTYVKTSSNSKNIIVSQDIGKTKWKLIKIINTREITKNIDKIFIAVYISLLFMFSIYISYSFFILILIHIPIKQLVKSMDNLGKGNYSKKKFVTYFDEDDSLANAFNDMSEKLEALQKNMEESYRESLSRELEALAFQIKPRFMCNTLEIIEKLSQIEKNSETRLLSKALLTITKYNAESTNNLISIDKELENIKAYTYIMNAQNYKPFNFKIDIDENLLNKNIPSLLIQPIIENSIKHGFKDIEKEAIILLSLKRVDNNIKIIIRDNGRGIDKVKLSKLFEEESNSSFKNHCLVNIKKRLFYIYSDKASLIIHSSNKNPSYFENIITIPIYSK